MNVWLHYTIILLIFVTVLTTADCGPTGKTSRKLRDMYGFTPRSKESEIETLESLILHDGDLIKAAAYKQLINMYKTDTGKPDKETLLPIIIMAATELVKNYAAVSRLTKESIIYLEGQRYVKACFKLLKNNSLCSRLKAQLVAAHFFGHKLYANRSWRSSLTKSLDEAKKHQENDETLLFLETRLSCEIKLNVENSNKMSRAIKSLVVGSAKKELNFDCIKALLKFEDKIYNVGSYIGEYYYLLGRAYAKNKEDKKAMEVLRNHARKDIIVDSKGRSTNKAVQELLEKIYFRTNSNM